MSRTTILSLIVSCAAHGGALVYLAGIDTAGPQAPIFSGGKGGGEIEVTIVPGMADVGFRMSDVEKPTDSEIVPDPAPVTDMAPVPDSDPVPVPVPVPDPAPIQHPVINLIPIADSTPAPVPVSPTSDLPHSTPDIVPQPDPVHPTSDSPHPTSASRAGPGTEAPVIDDPASLRPVYPMICRRLHHTGTAVVRIEIGEDGRTARVEITKSAGCPDLDRAALEAARKARFRPARSWGRAITCTVEQPILFELRKKP